MVIAWPLPFLSCEKSPVSQSAMGMVPENLEGLRRQLLSALKTKKDLCFPWEGGGGCGELFHAVDDGKVCVGVDAHVILRQDHGSSVHRDFTGGVAASADPGSRTSAADHSRRQCDQAHRIPPIQRQFHNG